MVCAKWGELSKKRETETKRGKIKSSGLTKCAILACLFVQENSAITELNLSGNRFGDKGIIPLSDAMKVSFLSFAFGRIFLTCPSELLPGLAACFIFRTETTQLFGEFWVWISRKKLRLYWNEIGLHMQGELFESAKRPLWI